MRSSVTTAIPETRQIAVTTRVTVIIVSRKFVIVRNDFIRTPREFSENSTGGQREEAQSCGRVNRQPDQPHITATGRAQMPYTRTYVEPQCVTNRCEPMRYDNRIVIVPAKIIIVRGR